MKQHGEAVSMGFTLLRYFINLNNAMAWIWGLLRSGGCLLLFAAGGWRLLWFNISGWLKAFGKQSARQTILWLVFCASTLDTYTAKAIFWIPESTFDS
jgi:hypothetical protein